MSKIPQSPERTRWVRRAVTVGGFTAVLAIGPSAEPDPPQVPAAAHRGQQCHRHSGHGTHKSAAPHKNGRAERTWSLRAHSSAGTQVSHATLPAQAPGRAVR